MKLLARISSDFIWVAVVAVAAALRGVEDGAVVVCAKAPGIDTASIAAIIAGMVVLDTAFLLVCEINLHCPNKPKYRGVPSRRGEVSGSKPAVFPNAIIAVAGVNAMGIQ